MLLGLDLDTDKHVASREVLRRMEGLPCLGGNVTVELK